MLDADLNLVTTVIGHSGLGSDSNAALYQNIDEPHAIVFDSYGNLVASSSSTIKLVEPNANGVSASRSTSHDLSAKRGL